MTIVSGKPMAIKDRYHGELLAVRQLCVERGLVFTEELRWACRALLTMAAVMDGKGPDQYDEDGQAWFPDGDDLDKELGGGGPGVGLMRLMQQELERKDSKMDNEMNTRTGRATTIKPAPSLGAAKAAPINTPAIVGARELGGASGRGCIHSGTPPMIPGCVCKGPSKTEILAINKHQWIEVPKDAIKLVTLKQRVSQANSQAKKDGLDTRFVCWQNEDDGMMIVRRAE